MNLSNQDTLKQLQVMLVTVTKGLYHCDNKGGIMGGAKKEGEAGIPIATKLYHGK